MQRDIEQTTRRVLMDCPGFRGGRILEIGCGTGRLTALYVAEALCVVGVEPDMGALLHATRNLAGCLDDMKRVGGGLVCASGADLPLRGACFDAVFFTLSLHHHPSAEAALAQARRVLRPGGLIFVLEPTVTSRIQRMCKAFEDEDHCLEAVERVLGRCESGIVFRREFTTRWVFADFDELVVYWGEYYGQPADRDQRRYMRECLEDAFRKAPLEVTDTLRLTCLNPAFCPFPSDTEETVECPSST
jgi:SAM-dependent methyltransferase